MKMFWFVVYLVGIWVSFLYCWGDDNGALELSVTDSFGVAVLWPLFAIKYLAIGIWAVLSAGFTLLV